MTASRKTANYDLPLYDDNDRPTWRGDVNATNEAIDSAIKAVSDSIPAGNGMPPAAELEAAIRTFLVANNVVVKAGSGLTAKQLDELTLFT